MLNKILSFKFYSKTCNTVEHFSQTKHEYINRKWYEIYFYSTV